MIFSSGRSKLIGHMQNQTFRRVSLVAALLIVPYFSIRTSAQSTSYLRPSHKTVVEKWLKMRPDLRLATEADNTNKEGLAGTRRDRGQGYQPYYAVGDFNGDRKEDFAIALVKKKKGTWPFVFAIFNGPLARFTKPSFIADTDLADGGIFFNPKSSPSQFRLAYGTFESDDCVILLPRGRTYVGNACLE